jgi:hypothetical protein
VLLIGIEGDQTGTTLKADPDMAGCETTPAEFTR